MHVQLITKDSQKHFFVKKINSSKHHSSRGKKMVNQEEVINFYELTCSYLKNSLIQE